MVTINPFLSSLIITCWTPSSLEVCQPKSSDLPSNWSSSTGDNEQVIRFNTSSWSSKPILFSRFIARHWILGKLSTPYGNVNESSTTLFSFFTADISKTVPNCNLTRILQYDDNLIVYSPQRKTLYASNLVWIQVKSLVVKWTHHARRL